MGDLSNVKHPRGLYVCTGTEVWERLGFFLVQSILILYLVNSLKLSDSSAYSLFTAITGLLYASPVIGGLLADKWLGFERAITFGIVLYIVGYFLLLSSKQSVVYIAFSLQIMANGLVKGNITSLLGRQYQENDMRRDSGFTFLYFGINVGQIIGPLLASLLIYHYQYRMAFIVSGFSLILCLLTFRMGLKYLKQHSKPIVRNNRSKNNMVYVLPLFIVVFLAFSLKYFVAINVVIVIFSLFSFLYLIYRAFEMNDKAARNRILAILVIFVFSVLYWGLFMQSFTSLLLFAERDATTLFLGMHVNSPFLISAQGVAIVVIAPFLSRLWLKLANSRYQPSHGMKLAYGFLFLTFAYALITLAIHFFSHSDKVNIAWVIATFTLLAISELCFSAIGLSAISKLSPANNLGLVMGLWFMTISAGLVFANMLARMAVLTTKVNASSETLPVYLSAFKNFAFISFVIFILSFLFVPVLKKLSR